MKYLFGLVVLLANLGAQGQVLSSTNIQPLKDITTKIIVQQESDPVYYGDEPLSALQRVVVRRCDGLLTQLKAQPVDWLQVREQVHDIEGSLETLRTLRYDLVLPEKESSRVVFNYFSVKF